MSPRTPVVLPGMAVPIYFPGRHSLTAAEHACLVDAKLLGFGELDELAAVHRDDEQVKRGNVQVLGPRPHPLAYVVGPHVLAIAPGVHDSTHGGWVRPGDGPRRVTSYERDADRAGDRYIENLARQRNSATDWDERVLHPLLGGAR